MKIVDFPTCGTDTSIHFDENFYWISALCSKHTIDNQYNNDF